MPRRNRPRGSKPGGDESRPLPAGLVVRAPFGWQARAITADRALKTYRCPGCDHEIAIKTAHVVAWSDDDPSRRRHWHKGCWDGFLRTGGPRS